MCEACRWRLWRKGAGRGESTHGWHVRQRWVCSQEGAGKERRGAAGLVGNLLRCSKCVLQMMWCAAHSAEVMHQAKHFGYTTGPFTFDWETIKSRRDAEVKRLNGVYMKGLDKLGIPVVRGTAKIVGPGSVDVDGTTYKVGTDCNVCVGCLC